MADAFGPPPHSTDPLAEPRLQGGMRPGSWRLLTNFTSPSALSMAFTIWPDDAALPDVMEAVYRGDAQSPIGPFPFLDETEGARIQAFFEQCRERAFPPFRDYLRTTRAGLSGLWGAALPAMQSLLLLGLRKAEREAGLWDGRTPRQKDGTVYAVRPGFAVQFCRVSALPGRAGERVCFPWGGPYREYGKIQGLLESRYAHLVFDSASPDLEVIPEGHVIMKMKFAGLAREYNRGFLGSRWLLAMPVVGMSQLKDTLSELAQVTQGICGRLVEVLPQIPDVMRSGRYSCQEGYGDYTEMAYAVLMGLLCKWAMDESLLLRPPSFRVTEDGAIVDRSGVRKVHGVYPDLPGIAILADAKPVWDWITSKA